MLWAFGNYLGHSMGSMVAFRASHELEQEEAGQIRAVIFSGFASVAGPSAGSPFGIKALFGITQVRNFFTGQNQSSRGDMSPHY